MKLGSLAPKLLERAPEAVEWRSEELHLLESAIELSQNPIGQSSVWGSAPSGQPLIFSNAVDWGRRLIQSRAEDGIAVTEHLYLSANQLLHNIIRISESVRFHGASL